MYRPLLPRWNSHPKCARAAKRRPFSPFVRLPPAMLVL
jgi:hypothetical protein